ncbi:MAG: group II intron reverse transcriptase/maturase [Proteobacteria bacterium]|nr:MAG: group II intron reverse transcriptase/maturase [Pseudomonadota bacterium]
MSKTKSFNVSKDAVWQAWKRVKANHGAAGLDGITIELYEQNLRDNLYKLWNRMASGSYFPPPVRTVPIPKKAGGFRNLGIPTVEDRIAQMVAKLYLEPKVEPHFHPDSYGYRPGKSAHDAIEVTRKRCWKYDWLLEFDIRGLFDNIPTALLMKAVTHHTDERWILLYVDRWLHAAVEDGNGNRTERTKGVPQGGVISPVLSNLFMHYAYDAWMVRSFPNNPICRYADDGIAHCKTYEEACNLKAALEVRMQECGLELHPEKTRIIYCRDDDRTRDVESDTKFTFLGFNFRPRRAKNKYGRYFVSFLPAVSPQALKSMRQVIRGWKLQHRVDKTIDDLNRMFSPILRGWMNYYSRFYKSELYVLFKYFNRKLIFWAMKKYKRLKGHKRRAQTFLASIAKKRSKLFPHWSFLPITIE